MCISYWIVITNDMKNSMIRASIRPYLIQFYGKSYTCFSTMVKQKEHKS